MLIFRKRLVINRTKSKIDKIELLKFLNTEISKWNLVGRIDANNKFFPIKDFTSFFSFNILKPALTLFFVKEFSFDVKETKRNFILEIIINFQNLLSFLLIIVSVLFLSLFLQFIIHEIDTSEMIRILCVLLYGIIIYSIFYIFLTIKHLVRFINSKVNKYFRRG